MLVLYQVKRRQKEKIDKVREVEEGVRGKRGREGEGGRGGTALVVYLRRRLCGLAVMASASSAVEITTKSYQ